MSRHRPDRRSSPGDYDRNRQIIRQWQILRTLQRSYRRSSELAREFGVTYRTILRDLYALEAAGFPLTVDDERRWHVLSNWMQEIA